MKRCLDCRYSLRDPGATPDQIIAQQVQSLCIRMPPSVFGFLSGHNMATVTAYPQVTAQTISCGEFAQKVAVNDGAPNQ